MIREKIVVCPKCGEEICIQVQAKDDIIFISVEDDGDPNEGWTPSDFEPTPPDKDSTTQGQLDKIDRTIANILGYLSRKELEGKIPK